MKITFQPTDRDQKIERYQTAQRESAVRRIGTETGYTIDIGKTASGHEIEKGHAKTTEEIMQEASRQNVALTRDYMAVMSNTMSDEDFANLQENGYEPGDTEVETAVTIVDRIKASLMQAGVSIAGYTDTIDMETLTEITGDAALAEEMSRTFSEMGVPLTEETAKMAFQALEEAGKLSEPSDDAAKYMITNGKEPVIEDLYVAQYSSTEQMGRQGKGYYRDDLGYLTKKAEDFNWDGLKSQIDHIIEDAGLEGVAEAEEGAKWLISSGIPLTKETLTSYMEMKNISLPIGQKALMQAMAAAVADGKKPSRANLTGAPSLWEQAAKIWKRTQELTDQAADLTAGQGKSLTLRNLDAAQRLLESGYYHVTEENAAARRQLEEIRLQMTIAANRELLKSGYSIETQELEKVIEALKDVEDAQNRILFGGEGTQETAERAALYEEATAAVQSIPQMPAAVVGRVSVSQSEFTLHQVREEGEALALAYKKANESYETFQTAPRSDMGDSIRKAFDSTESLLEELGLETTDANKRAVRILGYNQLEITEENIATVKAADQALRNVVQKMTPAATLQMIRDGKNPLAMTVEELDDYLSRQQQDDPQKEQEKFSRFLYKLEQKKEITEEEKQSYIGIYRLLRQVEKSDGAVIGSLIHQGGELSFKNLLTAVRTAHAKRMDTAVDDDTGVLHEVKEKGVSIDSQIDAAFTGTKQEKEIDYYRRLSREIYNNLDADKLIGAAVDEAMGLEAFAEKMRQTESDRSADSAYRREQIAQYRQAQQVEKNAVNMLEMLEEPVTLENVRAMAACEQDMPGAWKKIRQEADAHSVDNKNQMEEKIAQLEENFESREEAAEAYHKLADTQKEILDEAMYETDNVTSLDMRQLGLIYKQVSFTSKLADTERYEIPVMMEDSVMALHLQVIHSDINKGMVEASMDMEAYGKIVIKLQLEDDQVKGFLIGSQKGSDEALQEMQEQIRERLEQTGLRTESMDIGFRKNLHTGFSEETNQGQQSQTSTKRLYNIAKTVISVVRKQSERGSYNENKL